MICGGIVLVRDVDGVRTQCLGDTNVCDFGDVWVERKSRVLGDEAAEVDVMVGEEGSHWKEEVVEG